MREIAVVILNFNGVHHLKTYLPSVVQHSSSIADIIVVDNASSDDSVKFIQENYPQIQVIQLPKNLGYAGGYNEAVQRIKQPYQVFLNSDVEVTPNWLLEPINMLKEEQVAACQPKILAYTQPTHFEYAGGAGGFIDMLGYPFCRGRVFDTLEADTGQYNTDCKIFWASGAALFVKRADFIAAGGFDEDFFAHQEEIDLCWRFQRMNKEVWFCSNSTVYHLGGGTLPKSQQKVYLNFRNNLQLLYKNAQPYTLFWLLPIRLFLDILSAWKALLSNEMYFFKGVAQAHFNFLISFFKKKTSYSFPRKSFKTLAGVYLGSIVWDYFIRGKKIFTEIVKK